MTTVVHDERIFTINFIWGIGILAQVKFDRYTAHRQFGLPTICSFPHLRTAKGVVSVSLSSEEVLGMNSKSFYMETRSVISLIRQVGQVQLKDKCRLQSAQRIRQSSLLARWADKHKSLVQKDAFIIFVATQVRIIVVDQLGNIPVVIFFVTKIIEKFSSFILFTIELPMFAKDEWAC